ncbi:T9SS type A sorting domain-containing protein [Candidatus Acetothermia bacterium]|nr:T9SS type A sorting domain-containing protein [Candidatus Acetothermia bacterium]
MRINKYLLLTLAALVGVFAVVIPAQAADPCADASTKLKSGAACLVDLNVKWNELIGKLVDLNVDLNKALNEISEACQAMDSDEDCGPSAFLSVDTEEAKNKTDDAIADLGNAVDLLDEINGTGGLIEDFGGELDDFKTKLDGGTTPDYPLSDRTKMSAKRTVELIDSLVGQVSTALGGVLGDIQESATEPTCGGKSPSLLGATSALQTASKELGMETPDGDIVLYGEDGGTPAADHNDGLEGALFCVHLAIEAKDRALKKQLSQVKRSLSKLQKTFGVAINRAWAASAGLTATTEDAQARVYTLGGALVSVGSKNALSMNHLANGVYVIIYRENSRTHVEKLVVLH